MNKHKQPDHKDAPGRDERLGEALTRLPVSEDGPRFWTELSARLDAADRPRSATPVAQRDPVSFPSSGSAPIEPASLEEHRRGRARWRNPGMIGAAAALAAIVAVAGAVWVRGGDRGPAGRDVKVGTQPSSTPTARSQYPDCEGGKPGGSKPCTYPCVSLGSPWPTPPPSDPNCLYDPTGENTTPTTYTQYPPPPTTAPGSSSPPVPTAAN
jgi:hypothetical protein